MSTAAQTLGTSGRGGASKRAALAAAAQLRQVSMVTWLAYVALAIFVQLNWGLFGVCSRYLQTTASRPIPTIQLTFMVNAVALPGLLLFVALPDAIAALWRSRAARRAATEQPHPSPSSGGGDPAAKVANADGLVLPLAAADQQEQQRQRDLRAARRARLTSLAAAAGIGAVVATQALTLIYASRLTRAYLVQLVFMLTPLVTAIANKLLFRQNAPRALPIALFFAVAGSVMVIVGNWVSSNQAAAAGSARDTAVGLALATVSMFLLAAYLLLLQATQKLTTGRQVMWANVTVAVVVFGPLGAALEGADWAWVASLRPADWAVLFFAGFFINALNTIWTQSCSRVLGAAVVALFISCRLVSSLVGSIILLREIPGSPLTWAGFGVVIAAMSGFMVLQYLQGRRAEAAVADEAGAAAEQGSCEGSPPMTHAGEGGAGGAAAAGGAAGSSGPEVRQEGQRTSAKGELPV